MNLRIIFGFQVGRRGAIEAVAQSRASLFTGAALVLLTAIPRNYDQTFVLESPFWLIGPLIFSFFSGTFLFWVLFDGFFRRHFDSPESLSRGGQWRSFMSLFWMTAPLAWLYAIPVERFLNWHLAAVANLTLLAAVALWTVLLMARIVSVMQGLNFFRALAWIGVPACLEVLLVVFLGEIFGSTLSRRIMAAMSGMRNAPEEQLLDLAVSRVLVGALILLPFLLVMVNTWRLRRTLQPLPEARKGALPAGGLMLLSAVWIAIAVPAQIEQHRFVTHARLIQGGKYRESVEYLAHFQRKDFPASRRIEPNPYNYRAWEDLPKIMASLQPMDPEWIRRLYLEDMEVLFSHYWLMCKPDSLVLMFSALERLPEGKEWIKRNTSEMSKVQAALRPSAENNDPTSIEAARQLTNVLQRLDFDLGTFKK